VLQVSERNKSSPSRLSFPGILGGHFEEFVDEPILTPDVTPAQPPHLALPKMVLLDDVVQILDGSVAAPTAERTILTLGLR
jgi:hypothetical protein